MQLNVDKTDIIHMVMGTTPHPELYHILDRFGRKDGNIWWWDPTKLNILDTPELYDLYISVKQSWMPDMLHNYKIH
jgi:hypothetical protein